MKILAVDVGVGTQDILYYDTSLDKIENSIKMVLPSPTRLLAGRIRQLEENLFIEGQTMGGGPVGRAIAEHVRKGYRVKMTPEAARTVRDDLERVKALGIEISKENTENFTTIELGDVNPTAIKDALKSFGIKAEFDFIGVAVQDHGAGGDMGDRNFRFLKIREKLVEPIPPEEFSYLGDTPDYFTRMKSIERSIEGPALIMDSKFASVAGALCDPYVESDKPIIIMDVGNGHTLAASVMDGKIYGVMEHHTAMLTREKLEKFTEQLASGHLKHSDIHRDGGHGAHVLEPIGKPEMVVTTGPQRSRIDNIPFNVYHAAPAGDVMMTGPAGLIRSIKYRINW